MNKNITYRYLLSLFLFTGTLLSNIAIIPLHAMRRNIDSENLSHDSERAFEPRFVLIDKPVYKSVQDNALELIPNFMILKDTYNPHSPLRAADRINGYIYLLQTQNQETQDQYIIMLNPGKQPLQLNHTSDDLKALSPYQYKYGEIVRYNKDTGVYHRYSSKYTLVVDEHSGKPIKYNGRLVLETSTPNKPRYIDSSNQPIPAHINIKELPTFDTVLHPSAATPLLHTPLHTLSHMPSYTSDGVIIALAISAFYVIVTLTQKIYNKIRGNTSQKKEKSAPAKPKNNNSEKATPSVKPIKTKEARENTSLTKPLASEQVADRF